jgi:hypothetical protein
MFVSNHSQATARRSSRCTSKVRSSVRIAIAAPIVTVRSAIVHAIRSAITTPDWNQSPAVHRNVPRRQTPRSATLFPCRSEVLSVEAINFWIWVWSAVPLVPVTPPLSTSAIVPIAAVNRAYAAPKPSVRKRPAGAPRAPRCSRTVLSVLDASCRGSATRQSAERPGSRASRALPEQAHSPTRLSYRCSATRRLPTIPLSLSLLSALCDLCSVCLSLTLPAY